MRSLAPGTSPESLLAALRFALSLPPHTIWTGQASSCSLGVKSRALMDAVSAVISLLDSPVELKAEAGMSRNTALCTPSSSLGVPVLRRNQHEGT